MSTRSPSRSPTFSPSPGLLTPDLIHACSDFFFAHMYHTTPIVEKDQLQAMVRSMSQSAEAYCLVAALCAFMLIQPGIAAPISQGLKDSSGSFTNPKMGNALMEEAVRVRKAEDYIEYPTANTIRTSFFLFGCCFGLNKHNAAWFHLREATALVQLLGMQDESAYVYGDAVENSRKRRLFWLLFVTERAYALQKHRPLTLHATIGLPTMDHDVSASISGFIHLVNLYRPFDDMFIGLWNKSRADCTTYFLAHLQQELSNALPDHLDTTESQAADLRTSQQWLRTMVWQLSIMNGYLSSTSSDVCMTFRYPIEIAKDLVAVTSRISKQSMEVHGIGLVSFPIECILGTSLIASRQVEKVFDVACTLIDVMACVPDRASYGPAPQQYLNQMLVLISTLRGGEARYLPLIMAKIRDELPTVANQLPASLTGQAAAAPVAQGSAYGPLGGINGSIGVIGWNGVSGAVANGMNAMVGREIYIKQEPTSSNDSTSPSYSDGGSPFSSPPFMHYYPLS